jgi:anti-sigma-K factor RskA
MADNWTIWSRETTGQTDHGMTTWRMLLLFAIIAVVALLWLGTSSAAEPTSTTKPRTACEQLHRLERAGIHHGPAYWAARGGCPWGH